MATPVAINFLGHFMLNSCSKVWKALFIIGLFCCLLPGVQATENDANKAGRRIALVIGNADYQPAALPKLANPVNDAEDVAKALRGFGFEVIERKDQTLEGMNQAIAEFGSKLGGSDAALFYYAGHGVQVKNQNYLLPVNASIESEASVPYQAVNINQVLDEMDSGKSKINIVMLDACRNNPITGKFRSGKTTGLATPGMTPKGTVIVYATDPGNVAADGDGRNGLFTKGLLTAFKGKDLSLDGVLTVASAEVERISGQAQTPYVNGPKTLQKSFRFRMTLEPLPEENEKALWARIEASNDTTDFDGYLERFPKGPHAANAASRLKALRKNPPAVAVRADTDEALPVAEFEECLQKVADRRGCLARLKDFVKKNPKQDLAAARFVRRNLISHNALPFYEPLAPKYGKALCGDEDFALAVVSGLALPADYDDAAIARRLFGDVCRNELEAKVLEEMATVAGRSFLKDNACPILGKAGKSPVACQIAAESKPAPAAPEKLPVVDKKSLKPGIAKAYRGREGETVVIIPVSGTDLFLLKFDGVYGPWNGKTILHQRVDLGHGKADFWTIQNGSRWNSIAQRNVMSAYVPEYKPGNGFVIEFSDKATEAVDSQALFDAWQP